MNTQIKHHNTCQWGCTRWSMTLAKGAQRGFTLVEIMVVMVIIAMLVAVVGIYVFPKLGQAKVNTAHIQISDMDKALDLFKLDVGRYPTNAEGLQALTTPTASAPGWNGPYMRGSIPNDPWGNPYHYSNPGPGPNGSPEIISYGADNQPGGTGENQDIVNQQ